ncbi:hypothetical protein V5O48_010395 [Marasmius crinis-equi]|uniref:Uncharacterized protein n=1 Tax=Marasmius crinis-equi TaxID=585013 RepID=A0ABR3F8W5_9AGAR
MLQMRLYALYSLNRKVLAMMVATFIVTSTASAIIMGVVLSHITAASVNMPFVQGMSTCVPLNISPKFYTFWIPILAFETFLFCLALIRRYQTLQTSGSAFQPGKELVGVLIRDSVVYFSAMLAVCLTTSLLWSADLGLLDIPIGWTIAISCVLGNRAILNFRRTLVSQKQTTRISLSNERLTHLSNSSTFNNIYAMVKIPANAYVPTSKQH